MQGTDLSGLVSAGDISFTLVIYVFVVKLRVIKI